MKTTSKLTVLTVVAFLVLAVVGMIGCSKPAAEQSGNQATQYTCPMHSDVVQDKPGKCPKCGMELVEKH